MTRIRGVLENGTVIEAPNPMTFLYLWLRHQLVADAGPGASSEDPPIPLDEEFLPALATAVGGVCAVHLDPTRTPWPSDAGGGLDYPGYCQMLLDLIHARGNVVDLVQL